MGEPIEMSNYLRSELGDRRITLEHLRAFVSIVEGNGFADAGFVLNRSQSAITQSLQRLEEVLGCKLVDRRKGHVIGLTREGNRFFGPAKDILMCLADAMNAVQQLSMSGRVRLGVPDDFNVVDIHGALSRCLGTNRQLTIQVISDLSIRTLNSLLSGELDVAMLKKTSDEPALKNLALYCALRKEPLYWVASQPMYFDEIDELPLIVFPEGCAYRKSALRCLERSGKAACVVYTSTSDENISKAVSAGLGISLLPASAIADDHVILDSTHGFPDLPEVELILAVSSDNPLFLQFAQFLERTVLLGEKNSIDMRSRKHIFLSGNNSPPT